MDSQALWHKLRKAAASVASGLVAVKAEVNGLDVRTVREENAAGLFLPRRPVPDSFASAQSFLNRQRKDNRSIGASKTNNLSPSPR